jgi:Tfp pilus assembly protein PilX
MTQNPTRLLPARSLRDPRGFALVISLSLMVLLTVLAVGLLSLSSISLRSSTRGDAMAAARANARLAMMFALGELQQFTGPDQRVTATADLAGTATGDALPNGTAPLNNTTVNNSPKGLSAVQPGTRHWMGVWNQTATFTQTFTRTPSPNLIGWLISGNENNSAANRLTPASPVAAVDAGGDVDTKSAVILAGKNTVGGNQLDDYVSAPLVEIQDSGSGKKPVGRHAWWIGDEGVKAKLNLDSPVEGNAKLTYADLAAPRRGWETVDGFGSYPKPGSGNEELLVRVVSGNEAALLDPSIGGPTNSPLQRSFHAATTDSFGVLCDTLQGGLRLDLSAYLGGTLPTTAIPGVANSPVANANIIPTSVANRIRGPKWSALKDFSELSTRLADGAVKPASTDLQAAIAPVITDLRILFGVKLVPSGAADTYRCQPCAKIAVSLANPYPYPLKWTSPLELEIKNATDPARRPSRIWNASGQPAYVPQNTSEPAVLNNAVFTIPATTLPPGEARAYTIASPVLRPQGSTVRTTVSMGAFSSSSPSNFANSVLLDHASTNVIASGGTLNLDVREDATTTQINVELRSGGAASTLLRKIERFELDNAPFDVTQRKFSSALAKQFTEPVPLQLYSFQVSQPGADYASVLPSKDQLGLRSSTLRTFADFNMQATRFRKPIICYNPPPYFMQIANSAATLPFVPPGKDTGSDFTRNLSVSPMPWGRSPFDSRQTILFSPPQQLVSLAQLQHADLTADDLYVSVGHQPGNAVGNSYATPFVQRNRTILNRFDFAINGFNTAASTSTNYYDISHLLNTALWDTYYFSTVPRSGSTVPLNDRMVVWNPRDTRHDLLDGQQAAARLMVNGAHNVNSVEKDAWKALLAGSKHLSHPADGANSTDALYPRSLEQVSASVQPPTGSGGDSFSGFRRLTDAQIDAIATELTRQVRMRGPFVSLSHFVNRALAGITQNKDLGRSGALQSAIDNAGSNISPDGTKNVFSDIDPIEDRVNLQNDGSAPRADLVGTDATSIPNTGTDGVWPPTSHDLNPGAVAGILADKQMLNDNRYKREQGYRSTGIPGWLTQADLLQVIGPSLSARSDTFRIRAYGESLDPETGNPVAKAWCEAIVQRLPEYLDSANAPTDRGATVLTAINQKFGRRFQIVSFRWLSPHEI